MSNNFNTMRWVGEADGHLVLLDQTRLPTEMVYLDCRTAEDVWQAIKRLAVRGRRQLVWRPRTAFALA